MDYYLICIIFAILFVMNVVISMQRERIEKLEEKIKELECFECQL